MIFRLRGVELLNGFRGSPPADIHSLADLVSQVSVIGASLGGRLKELDLNPVLVHPKGVTVVDVVLSLQGDRKDESLRLVTRTVKALPARELKFKTRL